ncbi:hypothetical protein AGMMS49942_19330 [Spirochaetia bacterium]|nr:hypothetical protein AGMMS49942_19330 [Spirochaetia bacterium]
MKRSIFLPLLFLTAFSLFGDFHSFDELFPGLDPEKRAQVFSGVFTESQEEDIRLRFLPSGDMGPRIAGLVLKNMRPSCVVESLTVLPYPEGKPLELLSIYNAMGKVRDLKGRLYSSFTRKKDVPLFEEATRIASQRKHTAIPDPADSPVLPRSDTLYVCLKDVNFGNSYYQADIFTEQHGLLYGLSNFRNLSYGIIPVFKEKKFNAQFYVEPIAEGILVYSAAAAEVSKAVSNMVDIPSAIRKRIEVILGWLSDNISPVNNISP